MLGNLHSYFDRHKIQLMTWGWRSLDDKWNERYSKQRELNNERKTSWELRIKYIKELTGG
jgi:hypothetical protein